jgi:hypothetical protein
MSYGLGTDDVSETAEKGESAEGNGEAFIISSTLHVLCVSWVRKQRGEANG